MDTANRINKLLLDFKIFLDSASINWDNKYIYDWLQGNWELLVEAPLLQKSNIFLEIYGEGADCNDVSSRVCFPEATATHKISLQSKTEDSVYDYLNECWIDLKKEEFFFEEFVCYKDWYYIKPPFEFVLTYNSNRLESIVSIDDVSFLLTPITKEEK